MEKDNNVAEGVAETQELSAPDSSAQAASEPTPEPAPEGGSDSGETIAE